jgi:hypothetical protein
VQFAVIDGKDLPGPVSLRIAILRDEKFARQDQPADREKMPVPSFARTRSQRLQFDFLLPVGLELRFEIVLVHQNLPYFYLILLAYPWGVSSFFKYSDHNRTQCGRGPSSGSHTERGGARYIDPCSDQLVSEARLDSEDAGRRSGAKHLTRYRTNSSRPVQARLRLVASLAANSSESKLENAGDNVEAEDCQKQGNQQADSAECCNTF